MAAQDYLSRLQSGAAAGIHPLAGLGYEALAGMKAHGGGSPSSSSSKDSPGGLQLPDGTEIIKHTSSISGPKVPGTTNRGRKKTISLDPPFPAGSGAGALSHGVSSILGRSPATETRLTGQRHHHTDVVQVHQRSAARARDARNQGGPVGVDLRRPGDHHAGGLQGHHHADQLGVADARGAGRRRPLAARHRRTAQPLQETADQKALKFAGPRAATRRRSACP
ncbi:uncharacterized protein LOC119111479 [Pollicipes pollicipes]|uniref:uncharacterized protein LOC119111479 n=1 Tax=Pollicipes pollicipes TaxID=41117 RepID=UPI0018859459|nr:uncharacterized protein LOC119111479 [Pollicipes pollicipes]